MSFMDNTSIFYLIWDNSKISAPTIVREDWENLRKFSSDR